MCPLDGCDQPALLRLACGLALQGALLGVVCGAQAEALKPVDPALPRACICLACSSMKRVCGQLWKTAQRIMIPANAPAFMPHISCLHGPLKHNGESSSMKPPCPTPPSTGQIWCEGFQRIPCRVGH